MPLEYPHFTLFHLIHLISLHFLIYNLSLHIITPSTTSSHPLSSYHHHYLFFLALSGGQDLDPTEPKSLDNSGSSWTQTTLQVCHAMLSCRPFPTLILALTSYPLPFLLAVLLLLLLFLYLLPLLLLATKLHLGVISLPSSLSLSLYLSSLFPSLFFSYSRWNFMSIPNTNAHTISVH